MPGCRLVLVLGWEEGEEESLLRGMRVRLWRGHQDHWVTNRFFKTSRLHWSADDVNRPHDFTAVMTS